ncbi:hypothetical protein E2C01_045015 [Portunus trituberculatus]|uniref:Uncharacterized protein n=1 Tax=Portunus trituberculatus TaxID=210409 RepID=A0A5B7G0W3_PORTR|nr:hypothetical protein [Portunus trituberculatus]
MHCATHCRSVLCLHSAIFTDLCVVTTVLSYQPRVECSRGEDGAVGSVAGNKVFVGATPGHIVRVVSSFPKQGVPAAVPKAAAVTRDGGAAVKVYFELMRYMKE